MSPKLENGYTKIANELIDKFCSYRLSGEEWLVLWAIIRKTYGFNKKTDIITLSQFSKITGLKRQTVHRAIKKLSSKKITTVIKNDYNNSVIYEIQKDYTKWEGVIKKDYCNQKRLQSVINIGSQVSSKKVPLILQKKLLQKKERKKSDCFEDIWNRYPNKDGKKKALLYFKSSVKSKEDWESINKALKNYINSSNVKKGFIKNGSTWFNNWQDWVDWKEPNTSTDPELEEVRKKLGFKKE